MAIENIEMIKKYIKKIHEFLGDPKDPSRFREETINHKIIFQHLMSLYSQNNQANFKHDEYFFKSLDKYLTDEDNRIKFKHNHELNGLITAYLYYYSYCYGSKKYPHIFNFFHEPVLALREKKIKSAQKSLQINSVPPVIENKPALPELKTIEQDYTEESYSNAISILFKKAEDKSESVRFEAMQEFKSVILKPDILNKVISLMINKITEGTDEYYVLGVLASLDIPPCMKDEVMRVLVNNIKNIVLTHINYEYSVTYDKCLSIIHNIELPDDSIKKLIEEYLNETQQYIRLSEKNENDAKNIRAILNILYQLKIPEHFIEEKIEIIKNLQILVYNDPKNNLSVIAADHKKITQYLIECHKVCHRKSSISIELNNLSVSWFNWVKNNFSNIDDVLIQVFELAKFWSDVNFRENITNKFLMKTRTPLYATNLITVKKLMDKMTKEELMLVIVKMEGLAAEKNCEDGTKKFLTEMAVCFKDYLIAKPWALFNLSLGKANNENKLRSLPLEVIGLIGAFAGYNAGSISFEWPYNNENPVIPVDNESLFDAKSLVENYLIIDQTLRIKLYQLIKELKNNTDELMKEKENNNTSLIFSRKQSELEIEINSTTAKINALDKLASEKFKEVNLSRQQQILGLLDEIRNDKNILEDFFSYKFEELLEMIREKNMPLNLNTGNSEVVSSQTLTN
jgi:hypothetical protein